MRIFPIILLLWIGFPASAQTELEWEELSKGISWEHAPLNAVYAGFQEATFSPELKALDGKQIQITGYLLVLDGKQSVFLLSKEPMASCFFCGNGGPETIVDLQFDQNPPYVMDDLILVVGTLRLNERNPNACYYRIENAEALSFK